MSRLIENLNEIKRQKVTYVTPGNIRQGVTVYGITGTLEGGEGSTLDEILLSKNVFDKTNLPWMLPGFTIDLTTKDVVNVSELDYPDFQTINTLFTIPKPSNDVNEWSLQLQGGYLYIPTRHILYLLSPYNFLLYPDPTINKLIVRCIYSSPLYKIEIPEDLTDTPLYKYNNDENDNVESLEYSSGDIVDEIELDEDDKLYICTSLPIACYKESGEIDEETGDIIYTYDCTGSQDFLLPIKGSSWEMQPTVYTSDEDDYIQWGGMYFYVLNLNSTNTRTGRCTIETEPDVSTNLTGYFVKRFTDENFLLSDLWWLLENILADGCSEYISLNSITTVLGIILDGFENDGIYEILYETGNVFKLQNIYQPNLFFYISPLEDNIMSEEYPDQVEEYGYKFFIWGDLVEGFTEIEGGGEFDPYEALDLTDEILHQHPSSGIDHTIPDTEPER